MSEPYQMVSLQSYSDAFDIDVCIIMKSKLPDDEFSTVVTACNETFEELKVKLLTDLFKDGDWL